MDHYFIKFDPRLTLEQKAYFAEQTFKMEERHERKMILKEPEIKGEITRKGQGMLGMLAGNVYTWNVESFQGRVTCEVIVVRPSEPLKSKWN